MGLRSGSSADGRSYNQSDPYSLLTSVDLVLGSHEKFKKLSDIHDLLRLVLLTSANNKT